MSDVLDQSEIDALLNALTEEGDDADGGGGAGGAEEVLQPEVEVRTYDFKRPERVSKDQMRALEGLHERFARNLGAALSSYLRTIVEVKIRGVEQFTFAEFTYSLPTPTSFTLMNASPLDGQVCLEISPLIVYPIMDRMLGGSNAELYVPQRPLTQIEQRLTNRIIERAIDGLTEAWENVAEINFSVMGHESNPQLVQIVPPNEVVVLISFELKMGDRAGSMSLCIPFTVIEPVVGNLTNQDWVSMKRATSKNYRPSLEENLQDAKLEIRAYLAETTMTVQDLLSMEVGDVLRTTKEADSDLIMRIEGKSKFAGKAGQFRQNRAFHITRIAKPAEKL